MQTRRINLAPPSAFRHGSTAFRPSAPPRVQALTWGAYLSAVVLGEATTGKAVRGD